MSVYEIGRVVLLLISYWPLSVIGHGYWGAFADERPGKLNVTCELALGKVGAIESVKCSKILLSCEPKIGPNNSPNEVLCTVAKGEEGERWGNDEETTSSTSTSVISSTSPADGHLAKSESTTSPCWSPLWLFPGLVAIVSLAIIAGVWLWRICRRRQQATEIGTSRLDQH